MASDQQSADQSSPTPKLWIGAIGFVLYRPLSRWERFRAWLAGWRYTYE